MRTSTKALIGLIAAAAIVAFPAAGPATAAQFQTIDARSSEQRAPVRGFRGVAMAVRTTTGDTTAPIPSPATRARIDFDRNFRFNVRGLPRCNRNLEGSTTEQAVRACRRAQVGRGSAKVRIPIPQPPFFAEFPARVTAFNGAPRGRNPVLLLHSRVDALATTAILVGVLKRSNRGRRFGSQLDVRIPPLAGGAGAITEFQTRVNRRWRTNRGVQHYVNARCPRRSYNWGFVGVFTYANGTSLGDTARQRCRGVRR